jgi:hypothetical protein
MHAALILGVVLVGGCYNPALRNCTVQCAGAGDCGGDQVCGGDGWCASAEMAGQCGSSAEISDARATPIDTRIDAVSNTACLAACTNGTCEAGVCVIDCSTSYTCLADVICPGSVPCHVVCGDHSCQHHVECRMAATCEIECLGVGSCADELRCGTNRCSVTCSGAGSCKRVRCANACACEATCSGSNACIDVSECPQAGACKLGEGCTSNGSCDTC